MSQAKRDPLENRSNRLKLKPQAVPYWSRLAEGQFIGYFRPMAKGAGNWRAKWRDTVTGARKQSKLGTADDLADADGTQVLTWAEANDKARAWFEVVAHEALMVAGGEVLPKGPFTINAALDAYFADGERRGVKGLSRDKQRAGAWIRPELGPVEVSSLTRARIESWLDKLAKSPRRVRTPHFLLADVPAPKPREFQVPRAPKAKPVPPAAPATEDEKRARKDSANRVLTVLKAALNHAMDRRLVTCTGEAWRETKPYRGTTKARVRFLSVEDQVCLVNVCPQDFRRLVKGALFTGGRYGELARACIQDFDPTGGTLFLVGKGTGEGKPRRVVLTEEGQAFFQDLAAGRPAGDLLFLRDQVKRRKRQEVGSAWGHSDQARFMTKACETAGLDPLGFHELRHSYASMLVNAGCPLVYVAAQLGHSDTRMVEKHYGHLAPNALAESVRALMPKLGFATAPKVAALKIGGRV